MLMSTIVEFTLALAMKLGAVILFAPIFLFPAIAIASVGGFLGKVYLKAQLPIKREMSNAKGPVLGVFGNAINGLSEFVFRS